VREILLLVANDVTVVGSDWDAELVDWGGKNSMIFKNRIYVLQGEPHEVVTVAPLLSH
jgi:hypothetical protein